MRNLYDKIPGAPNFRYKEFVKSMTALRYGINNIPPDEKTWRNIESLAVNVLQPIRNEFGGIRILSGYRSPKLNIKIGGSPTSNHCRGEAADIEPLNPEVTLLDIFNYINNYLKFRWVICEYFPTGWIHVDYREIDNIKGIKLKDEIHNYKIVNSEYINNLYKDRFHSI